MGFDEDVALARNEAKRFALQLSRVHLSYHVLLLVLAIMACVSGWKLWAWHLETLARLEARAAVLVDREHASATAASVWRTQALALAATYRVDTIRTNNIIRNTITNIVTVPIPMPQPDGSTSIVPMPMVPAAQFTLLAEACTRERHDCAQQLAARDSAAHQDSLRITALQGLFANSETQRKSEKRASFWPKLEWGAVGAVIGRVSCIR